MKVSSEKQTLKNEAMKLHLELILNKIVKKNSYFLMRLLLKCQWTNIPKD